MIKKSIFLSVITPLLLAGLASAGISKNTPIKGGDALLLGGEQPGRIQIDGQNRGSTEVELLIENELGSDSVEIISPGGKFFQSVPRSQTLVIQNKSEDETARVYWHISRFSSQANARIRSDE